MGTVARCHCVAGPTTSTASRITRASRFSQVRDRPPKRDFGGAVWEVVAQVFVTREVVVFARHDAAVVIEVVEFFVEYFVNESTFART